MFIFHSFKLNDLKEFGNTQLDLMNMEFEVVQQDMDRIVVHRKIGIIF